MSDSADESPNPPRPPVEHISRMSAAMLTAAMAAVAMLALVWSLPVPYVLSRPGPTLDIFGDRTADIVSVKGAPTYPTDAQLSVVTISVSGGPGRHISLAEALRAVFDDRVVAEPTKQLYPTEKNSQDIEKQGKRAMNDSQQAAAVAALTELGYDVPAKVLITELAEQVNQKGDIKAGDQLTKIGDVAINTLSDVPTATKKLVAGQPTIVSFTRAGEPHTSEITAYDHDGKARLGLFLGSEFDVPVDISFDLDRVGGPSAGLVFSLAIMELLTEDKMLAGKIAGTGTMSANGQVGSIGGITLKMQAAKRDGAQWFLVPEANCAEAAGQEPPGLNATSVATLAQAVTAVKAIAAGNTDDLPTCATVAKDR